MTLYRNTPTLRLFDEERQIGPCGIDREGVKTVRFRARNQLIWMYDDRKKSSAGCDTHTIEERSDRGRKYVRPIGKIRVSWHGPRLGGALYGHRRHRHLDNAALRPGDWRAIVVNRRIVRAVRGDLPIETP